MNWLEEGATKVAYEDGLRFIIQTCIDNPSCLVLTLEADGSHTLDSRMATYSPHNAINDLKRRAEVALKEYLELGSIWTGSRIVRPEVNYEMHM